MQDSSTGDSAHSVDSATRGGVERVARPSALAGTWYPAEADALRRLIDDHLDEARCSAPFEEARAAGHRVRGLIIPHAGLNWSGATAARGCALLEDTDVRRVILLGTAHHLRFPGISLDRVGAYETPLGSVPVDLETVDRLLEQPDFAMHPAAHTDEHSIEIELPFLQSVLGADFKLVPALVSSLPDARIGAAARAIDAWVDEQTVLIASSDFTHFGEYFGYQPFPGDADAGEHLRELDLGAVDSLLGLDRQRFEEYCSRTGITVCGYQPIRLLLEIMREQGAGEIAGELLGYETSGGMTGDFSHSVSYAAVAFSRPETSAAADDEIAPVQDDTLTPEQCDGLLGLARRTITLAVADPDAFRTDDVELPIDPCFAQTRAVFVTLRIAGELRGCIGTVVPFRPLAEAVVHAAWSAAFDDPRFAALAPGELEQVRIEISVLSPLRSISAPADVVVGRDGVMVEHGGRRGVFLPQVALEQGWDREAFLERLAIKAGLPPSPWIADATYQVFQVQVMEESEDPRPSADPRAAG